MFGGHSGVGKSTLVNTLDEELSLRTGLISKSHASGLHTTTFAEMFALNSGGYIIDTPGIRAFGLIDFDKKNCPIIFRKCGPCYLDVSLIIVNMSMNQNVQLNKHF